MWDDLKKISNLLYDQSKEQKDIALLKLRLISYNSKRESAFARLGNLIFKAYAKNKKDILQDAQILKALKNLDGTEKEMKKVSVDIEKLHEKTASGRKNMVDSVGKTWDKVKTKLSTPAQTGQESATKTAEKVPSKAVKSSVNKTPKEKSEKTSKKTSKKTDKKNSK